MAKCFKNKIYGYYTNLLHLEKAGENSIGVLANMNQEEGHSRGWKQELLLTSGNRFQTETPLLLAVQNRYTAKLRGEEVKENSKSYADNFRTLRRHVPVLSDVLAGTD